MDTGSGYGSFRVGKNKRLFYNPCREKNSVLLRLLIITWEGDMQSFSANMLNAVAKLIAVYQDQMDDESFKEKLGAVSLKSLIRTAKERRPCFVTS